MLDSIYEAIEDIRQGKMVIVVDDEDRENEGDFIIAAQFATAESINFMATHGKGLICAPLTKSHAEKLNLPLMIQNSSDSMETAFTVSIDASHSITTGISTSDRAYTLNLMADSSATEKDFARPGHVFPLIAKDGGTLVREGHTEAAVDLMLLAGLKPVGVICEILNEDGSCARVPDLKKYARKWDMKLISIADLITYRKNLIAEKGVHNEQSSSW